VLRDKSGTNFVAIAETASLLDQPGFRQAAIAVDSAAPYFYNREEVRFSLNC
jgi:hypothetical protein